MSLLYYNIIVLSYFLYHRWHTKMLRKNVENVVIIKSRQTAKNNNYYNNNYSRN